MRALSGTPTAMIVDADTRLLAVAVDKPPAVLLYPLDDDGEPGKPTTVALPGPADTLTLARPGGPLLAAAGSSGDAGPDHAARRHDRARADPRRAGQRRRPRRPHARRGARPQGRRRA